MIPSEDECKALWEKYSLPETKRVHVMWVAKVAMWMGKQCQMINAKCQINEKLLLAGALLHDIDKHIPTKQGEQHPDTGVRILKEEGMMEVSHLVRTHPLHAILNQTIAPKTWEEKILYLSDKMVKHEVITVDERFRLWNEEHLPADAQNVLNAAYPKVKELEKELLGFIGVKPEDVAKFVK